MDLNRFKEVNDTHGHSTGDQLLVLTARLLRTMMRIADSAFRVGGDEFALLAPQTTQPGAVDLAERVREGFANEVGTLKLKVPVSIAYGAATCPRETTSSGELFALADRRLYEFKRAIGSPRCAPRRYKRIPTEEFGAYVVLTGEEKAHRANIVDFSFGGLGLRVPEKIQIPDRFEGEVHLPALPAATLTLQRVHVTDDDGGLRVGCAFLAPTSSSDAPPV